MTERPAYAISHPVTPRISLLTEGTAIALFVLILGSTLGPLVPLGTAALGVILIGLGRWSGSRWRGAVPFLMLPALAVLSTLWSPDHAVTARFSVQLFITFLTVLAVVVVLSPSAFLRSLLLASLLISIASIADGTMGPSIKGPVLVGLAGSKNAMATIGFLLFISATSVVCDQSQRWAIKAIGAIGIAIGIYLIATTRASGVIVISLLAPLIAIVLLSLRALPRRTKLPLLILVAILMSPLLFYAADIANTIADYGLAALEKDRTLTGREYIWKIAGDQFDKRPIIGNGYRYFFMSDQVDVTGILRSQNVTDPHGFNFHNTYYELAVDLGIIGVIVGALSISVSLIACLKRSMFERGIFWVTGATFIFCMVFRSFGETLFQAYSLYGPLIFAFGLYAFLEPEALSDQPTKWRRRYRSHE